MLSLVVPLYKSEVNLPDLLKAGAWMNTQIRMEAVFVVDGSPDRCAEILRAELPRQPFESRLIELSRNFGAFSAITAGMAEGTGDYFALLAAELQEAPEVSLGMGKRRETGGVEGGGRGRAGQRGGARRPGVFPRGGQEPPWGGR